MAGKKRRTSAKLGLSDLERLHTPLSNYIQSEETMLLRSVVDRIDAVPRAGEPEVRLELSPEYQRAHVWTDTQREQFMGHVFGGGIVPPVIVHMGNLDEPDEVIDGKQRLTTMYRWAKGEIAALLYDGTRVRITDFDEPARRLVMGPSGLTVKILYARHLSLVQRMELYLRLNNGGTYHTPEEIERVRTLLEAARAGRPLPPRPVHWQWNARRSEKGPVLTGRCGVIAYPGEDIHEMTTDRAAVTCEKCKAKLEAH
jgi:hypothetical protein